MVKTSQKRLRFSPTGATLPCTGSTGTVTYPQNLVLTRWRDGGSTPMFRSLISRGAPATNGLLAYKQTYVYQPGLIELEIVQGSCPNVGKKLTVSHYGESFVLPSNTPVPTSLIADAKNSAAIGIRKKILSQQQSFSGLTFLGELREALQLIKNPGKAAFDYTHQYLRNQQRLKRRLRKKDFGPALAESWLEFSFGIAPLLNDVNEIASASISRINDSKFIRLSFTGDAESSTSTVASGSSPGSATQTNWSEDTVVKAKCRYIVGYRVSVSGPGPALSNIIQMGGFNLTNIIPTAWELLPWSFFIDYFSNVGDVIQSNLVSLEGVAWTNYTERWERSLTKHSFNVRSISPTFIRATKLSSSFHKSTYSTVKREGGGVPYSELRFDLPGSRSQFLNLAALARLQFS